jgi:fucose 4-O-acetylase-like acetyltransferase
MRPTRLLVFFFISGYLIRLESFDFKKMMKSITKKLLFPYFVFTLIIWLPKHIVRGGDISFEAMFIDIVGGYASWFVAALAVSKITLSLILNYTRSLKIVVTLCFVLSAVGFILTNLYGKLPWNANYGLISLFYLGLGMIYRKYEKRLAGGLKTQMALSLAIYFICVVIDYFFLGKSTYIFKLGVDGVTFVGVTAFMFLSLLGIWMMISIVKLLPENIKWMTFIGKNSLTYYYLNTGLLMVLIPILKKMGFAYSGNNFITVILFVVTVLLLTLITKLVLRYAPWMVGNFKLRKK